MLEPTEKQLSENLIREVAQCVAYFTPVQKKFDDIYYADKYRFYSAAIETDIFSGKAITSHRLETEAAIKRNIGILLVSEEDASIYHRAKTAMFQMDPGLKQFISAPLKHPDYELYLIKGLDPCSFTGQKRLSLICAAAYLLNREYPEIAKESAMCTFVDHYIHNLIVQGASIQKEKEDNPISRAELVQVFDFTAEDWKLIRSITGAEVIEALRQDDPMDVDEEHRFPSKLLASYSDSKEKHEILCVVSAFWDVLLASNVQWGSVATNAKLTRKEQENILVALLRFKASGGECRPHHFVAAYMVYALGKELDAVRSYFWEHNEDNQILAIQQYRDELLQLRAEVERLTRENLSTKEHIRKLECSSRKNEYSQLKPYMDEMASLKKQVEEVDRLASENESLTKELERLRRYVLTENDSPNLSKEEAVQIIKQYHRIVIIGGHTNWRKKCKAEFPTLEVLDGTATNTDLRMLDSADIVIFYSHNMSHSAYDRTIRYLRQNNICFDYLPRTTHLDLLAIQIAEILRKNLQGDIQTQ